MIDLVRTSDPEVLRLLSAHPRVANVATSDIPGLQWRQGDWTRTLTVGPADVFGLPEFIDNNPLVCADHAGVPSELSTLAAIALGPLIDAGLLIESPIIISSWEADDSDLDATLAGMGWSEGASVIPESQDLGPVIAIAAMAAITTPEDIEEIDALYEERFGRSFFVVREEDKEWNQDLVLGTPRAAYRMRITVGDPNSLLTVLVMADRKGKAGATQLVHTFNVMAGFEETLGLA